MTEETLIVQETRKLASFRIVEAIEPIEGADAIELVVVGGWKVVTKKGEFAVGDPCVYFEIDSFLPDGVPAFQFLVDKSPKLFNGVKGHKLRTIKLRGQISQGLVVRVEEFPLLTYLLDSTPLDVRELEIINREYGNDSLQELVNLRFGLYDHETGLAPQDLNLNTILGIVKWEPAMSAQLSGMAQGLFPSFIRKTDQERAQNLKAEILGYEPTIVPANAELNRPQFELPAKARRDQRYEVSMKLDGSSMTVFARVVGEADENGVVPIESGVCSRNLQLKINEANAENSFVKMAMDSHLLSVLEGLALLGHELAVQGELMGPAIQNNREQLSKHELFVFDIYDIRAGRYLLPQERSDMFDKLVERGARISHVPVLAWSMTLDDLNINSMDELLTFAEGPSLKHPVREGLVYKSVDSEFSFKTISNVYLAKEKD